MIERDKLVDRVRDDVGPYFQQKLEAFRGHPAVGEVRGLGLIGAIELLPSGGKVAITPGMALGNRGARLVREEGSIVRGIRDLLAIAPALIISREEIDELCASIDRALARLWD